MDTDALDGEAINILTREQVEERRQMLAEGRQGNASLVDLCNSHEALRGMVAAIEKRVKCTLASRLQKQKKYITDVDLSRCVEAREVFVLIRSREYVSAWLQIMEAEGRVDDEQPI